jgi:hypothetical protein
MQEIKKTAFFAVIGSFVFTLANLAISYNALLHESQYLLTVKGDTHTQREYINYKASY